MKALSVQQPFAFEIMSGQKTIDARDQDSLHRGDVLVCSSAKPAFSRDDMEELEDEYGVFFLYGSALCIARLVDVRLMRKGDEQKALMDKIDPEAYSWVFEHIRPVVPFPVKTKQGLYEVDDSLITVSPFSYDQPVVVNSGTRAREFGLDFSGWHGRTSDIQVTEDGEPRIRVLWDSISLAGIPIEVIGECEKEGIDWTGVLLRFNEMEPSTPRDTREDVQDAIANIMEENPTIFEE
ncbi:MAG: hypothetical protein AAGU11_02455 [Syntrophobacteraceae bacterium]